MKVIGKRVLISVEKPHDKKTESGLVLLDQRDSVGTVVNAGEKCDYPFKTGDKVMWQKGSRMATVKHEDKEFYLFDEKDIICVVES